MEGPKKRELDENLSVSTEQVKKKKIENRDDNIPNLPSTSTAVVNIANDDNIETDEEKDLKKLEQETCHLTDINKFFPDLVWKKVMSKIKTITDITDCSSASPYFGNLLSKKRYNEVVLPKVFSILSKYYQDEDTLDESYKETNLNSITWTRPPNKPEINPMTNFWKCRLVCKAWNSAIESLHDDHETGHFCMKMDLTDTEDEHLETWAADQFGADSGAEEFLAHFDPTHFDPVTNRPIKNPFLGRCVQLHYYRNNDGNNVHPSIMELLRKYGEKIWYFCLYYFYVPAEPNVQEQEMDVNRLVEFYTVIRNIVERCPRLRVLRILYSRQAGEDEENIPLDIQPILQPTQEEIQALTQEIREHPLPKFANLEFLSTMNLPTPIFNQLIDQNRIDVRQLEIFRKDFHQDYNLFVEGKELPKLEILSLAFASVADFEKFENCPFNLKLEQFHFWYDQTAEFFPWSRVFQAIEKKLDKESCNELLLQMPLPRNEVERELVLKETFEWRLNFPGLERITIFDEAALCLDFLLPAEKTLEKIVIRYNNNGEDGAVHYQHLEEYGEFGEKQNIQFLGYKEKINESNIFQNFMNMEEFIIIKSKVMGGSASYELKGKTMAIQRWSNF